MTSESIRHHQLRTDSRVTIRSACIDDMPAVAIMIQKLANYQMFYPSTKICVEKLQRDGFLSSPPAFYCLVAEVYSSKMDKGPQLVSASGSELGNKNLPRYRHLVGYAIYFPTYSPRVGRCLMLQEFYVDSTYRQQGIGSQLFEAVVEEAIAGGCSCLDFHVLQWNPARAFYERRGAMNLTQDQGLLYYRLKPQHQ